jgi:hypothetical protein
VWVGDGEGGKLHLGKVGGVGGEMTGCCGCGFG